MNFRNALHLSTVAVLLAGGGSLVAQVTTGAIHGKIVTADGRPVQGARISLESSALFQGRVLTTDAKGEYRAQLLPVGNYLIKVSASGFLGKSVSDFRVGVGTNLNLDFQLKPQQEQGTVVEVVATSGQESLVEDKVSVNFSGEDLQKLPTNRSFGGALALSPGVVTDNRGQASIRGGNTGGFSTTIYRVDGIDVTDQGGSGQPDAPGKYRLYEPLPDSIEDVQVVLAALNARYGRTQGGSVNIVTRSGSNDFAGTIRATMNRPSWTGNLSQGAVDGNLSQSENHAVDSLSRWTDITVSGPIIKDRLWFYMGTRLQPKNAGVATLGWNGHADDEHMTPLSDIPLYSTGTFGKYADVDAVLKGEHGLPAGFRQYSLIQDTDWGKTIAADTKYTKYEGKLTGLISANHTLSMTYLFDKAIIGGRSGERSDGTFTLNKEFMGDNIDTTKAWTLNWNGAIGDKWFVEARLFRSRLEQEDVIGPTTYPYFVQSYLNTGDPNVRITQTTGNQQQWEGPTTWYGPFFNRRASGSLTPAIRGNDSFNINLHSIQEAAGQHELDFGYEQFQSVFQYGRERQGNMGFWVGGMIYNPTAKDYLYPTFYTSQHGLDAFLDDGADTYQQYWDPMRGPGAHVERYWAGAGTSKNKSRAFWFNDTWTLNPNVNLLAGIRLNKFNLYDTDGSERANLSIAEPRLQLKWNPDGKGAEIYSISVAKLASAYGDEMAAGFRSNGWYLRTVHPWKGIAGQPAIDTPEAALDPTFGVRWVDYKTLTDVNNYGAPSKLLDQRYTYQTKGLQVPYAMEYALGYTRNYETGNIRINAVQRTYQKEWVSFVHDWGYDKFSFIQDPSGQGAPEAFTQNIYWLNSKFDKVYRSLELAWQENLSSRLSFGGNMTWARMTGRNNMDYYNYELVKKASGVAESEYAPEGLLSDDLTAQAWLTYTHPVGKGNFSVSARGNYYRAGVRSLRSMSDMSLPDILDPHTGDNMGASVNTDNTGPWDDNFARMMRYYGGVGGYRGGSDYYNVDLRLQTQIPLKGKVMLVGHIQIDNLFNRILRTTVYDWGAGDEGRGWPDGIVAGVPLSTFSRPWGSTPDHNYFSAGRRFAEFSIGLKF